MRLVQSGGRVGEGLGSSLGSGGAEVGSGSNDCADIGALVSSDGGVEARKRLADAHAISFVTSVLHTYTHSAVSEGRNITYVFSQTAVM